MSKQLRRRPQSLDDMRHALLLMNAQAEISYLADPLLEAGGILLAYNDLFIDGQRELNADLASLQGFEAFDIIGVDDIFPIGPVKDIPVQLFLELAEVALFGHIFPAFLIYEEYQLMLREEIPCVFHAYGLELHPFFYKYPGSLLIVRVQVFVNVIMIAGKVVLEVLVFPDGILQLVLADGFQQIVDAAIFEGLC